MNRFALHFLFWICYFLLFAYISFLWDKSTFLTWTTGHVIVTSASASVLFVIPQIIFPYYMIYRGIDNILKKNRHVSINIIEAFIVLAACIILDRCISNFIALPYIYKSPELISPLLETKRLFVAFMNIGFAFGLMFSAKSIRDQFAVKEREKNLLKEKLETELKFLKNQTNPHFLLNTLNNIYALARKKSDDTAEVVMRLSELLRFMLYESDCSHISLTKEIKVLEDYLELQALRYDQRLSVSFEKEVDDGAYKITPLLLLPFLENAFKHGISETRFESFIHIVIKVKDGILNFEIENSKDALANDINSNNIGLTNIKRQLELTYSDYKLNVDNRSKFFYVNLLINLNSYFEI